MSDYALPAPGTRVCVFSTDRTIKLGYGTYDGEVAVVTAIESEEVRSQEPHYPDGKSSPAIERLRAEMCAVFGYLGLTTSKITLDTGMVVYGIQCRWIPVEQMQATEAGEGQ